ncbi:MAG: hypothetical protein J6M93_02765 [Succinivibrio sp.]|nr:hypothetical protein [Succinivibrio sp.]
MSDLTSFKCPCCGGTLEFDSKSQKMKCPYCDTELDVESFRHEQDDNEKNLKEDEHLLEEVQHGGSQFSAEENADMESYLCQSCGGQIVVPKGTGAGNCPFCGNPQVMPANFEGTLKPDFVVPFKLDAKAVKAAYMKHLEGKHFLPAVFRDENHISEIRGVYVPYWLFDSHMRARMVFSCENIERYEDSRYRYVKHIYYDAYRKGVLDFADVPADGSSVMADDLMESIEPFNPEDGVEYLPAYLSGYAANRYDVDEEAVRPRVQERMSRTMQTEFEKSVTGYDRVKLKSSDIKFKKISAKYVLYPVWLLNTTWRGQRFTFAMNGQTGRFVGNLPRDDAAYWRTFALLTVALGIVFSFVVYFCMVD